MLYSLFILFSAVSLLFFALFIALPYADEISDVFNLIFFVVENYIWLYHRKYLNPY